MPETDSSAQNSSGMDNYGFWSILPPLVAIILAIRTKQVLISLLTGLLAGSIILHHAKIVDGITGTVTILADVFKNDSSTKTIMFTLLIGVLLAFIQHSGGVEGFINRVRLGEIPDDTAKLSKLRSRYSIMAACTGVLCFVESNLAALTVGTLFRPIFDKLKLPREKLAYIADSVSAPICIFIPLNAWGGFIMGLLVLQGFTNPFTTMLNAMVYNFYPVLTIALVFFLAITGRDFGLMRKAIRRADTEGRLIARGSVPMVSAEITVLTTKSNVKPKAFNMFIPMGLMVMSIPLMLIYTGWSGILEEPGLTTLQKVFGAIGKSSGATAVLYSVLISLTGSIILYLSQKIMTVRELTELSIKGISGMTQMALIMIFAFAIGNLCNQLGTGLYVAEVSENFLSPKLVPFVVFIISCFIAFSTGTSWGTFAIMIPIAVPMAEAFDTNIHMAIAAALGGGVFGDHCSPVSDTTMIASMASASDHIDHVRTQLPYALFTGVITAMAYLILGLLT
jgi:tetracycline resistance efflux pump